MDEFVTNFLVFILFVINIVQLRCNSCNINTEYECWDRFGLWSNYFIEFPHEKCIPKRLKCDGFINCPFGDDEHNCNYCNKNNGFICITDNTCILKKYACNNDNKWNCKYQDDVSNIICNNNDKCNDNEFKCQDTSRCIPNTWLCDGFYDCINTEDENPINCYQYNPVYKAAYDAQFGTDIPTINPTFTPTIFPTSNPSNFPTYFPTNYPTIQPSKFPTNHPSQRPTTNPTNKPTIRPTIMPSIYPSQFPTTTSTTTPSMKPSYHPTLNPSSDPTETPSISPSLSPSNTPTINPSQAPTMNPSQYPTNMPTKTPSETPTEKPSSIPTEAPSKSPSNIPTQTPSSLPTYKPTKPPTTPEPTAINSINRQNSFTFNRDSFQNRFVFGFGSSIPATNAPTQRVISEVNVINEDDRFNFDNVINERFDELIIRPTLDIDDNTIQIYFVILNIEQYIERGVLQFIKFVLSELIDYTFERIDIIEYPYNIDYEYSLTFESEFNIRNIPIRNMDDLHNQRIYNIQLKNGVKNTDTKDWIYTHFKVLIFCQNNIQYNNIYQYIFFEEKQSFRKQSNIERFESMFTNILQSSLRDSHIDAKLVPNQLPLQTFPFINNDSI